MERTDRPMTFSGGEGVCAEETGAVGRVREVATGGPRRVNRQDGPARERSRPLPASACRRATADEVVDGITRCLGPETAMEPADRRGLHGQPLAASERAALLDRVDAFLAGQLPIVRPDEPTHRAGDCPDCGHPGELFRPHDRYGPGGTGYGPCCGWEEPPC